MSTVKRENKLAKWLAWIVLLIFALLPFHAFITVWLSSGIGHYTAIRLWKEFLLAGLLIGAMYLLIKDSKLQKELAKSWPVKLIALYSLLVMLWAIYQLATGHNTHKAIAYGVLLALRFLVFFLVVLIIASKTKLLADKWPKFIILPALAVSVFGILQYLALPYDFLKHFGYSDKTIYPYETINHDINKLRVASTLRGANPLGAYLLLPISLAGYLVLKIKNNRFNNTIILALLLCALVFTFSRSAWLGFLASSLFMLWQFRGTFNIKKILWPLIAAVVLLLVLGSYVFWQHRTVLENAFLHTDKNSTAVASSNEGHLSAFKTGLSDIYNQPLGRGAGTAGPASVYNNLSARIAENYYLQTGQEFGLAGMSLFIAIIFSIGLQLWRKKSEALPLVLLASLIGISVVNMLSHGWTDDTIAYLWWGLAGIALSPKLYNNK